MGGDNSPPADQGQNHRLPSTKAHLSDCGTEWGCLFTKEHLQTLLNQYLLRIVATILCFTEQRSVKDCLPPTHQRTAHTLVV